MDLLHGFEVLSTTEETLFNSRNASRLVQNRLSICLLMKVSVSYPNPSAYTDNGSYSKTPNPHYDFDVGLVLTEFLSTLKILRAIYRSRQKYPQKFPEDKTSELVTLPLSLFCYKGYLKQPTNSLRLLICFLSA